MCRPSDVVKSGVDTNYTPKEGSLYLKINGLLIDKEVGTSLIPNTYTHTCIHMFNDAWVLPSESIVSTSAT